MLYVHIIVVLVMVKCFWKLKVLKFSQTCSVQSCVSSFEVLFLSLMGKLPAESMAAVVCVLETGENPVIVT